MTPLLSGAPIILDPESTRGKLTDKDKERLRKSYIHSINPRNLSWELLPHIAEDVGFRTFFRGDGCSMREDPGNGPGFPSFVQWFKPLVGPRRFSQEINFTPYACGKLFAPLLESNFTHTCTMTPKVEKDGYVPGSTCGGHLPSYRHAMNHLLSYLTIPGKVYAHVHFDDFHGCRRNNIPDMDIAMSDLIGKLAEDSRNIIFFGSDHGIHFCWGDIEAHGTDSFFDHKQIAAFMITPKQWKLDHSAEYAAMVKNSRELTTHFDMYNTLRYLLEKKSRGPTLFEELGSRTCADVGIKTESCSCATDDFFQENMPMFKPPHR